MYRESQPQYANSGFSLTMQFPQSKEDQHHNTFSKHNNSKLILAIGFAAITCKHTIEGFHTEASKSLRAAPSPPPTCDPYCPPKLSPSP
uniref:AlNc14C96G5883 protein n=1 Tax=Albugo laibachii Nc14 TaxID=890382 RepID=F0WH08_9STRA|nr:AlNc14C96G5883 [Albugo laibachii Nc14]|eukprot:CCA20523.1 AlNc14C96G5883 [Albugo laibachii Nc14]